MEASFVGDKRVDPHKLPESSTRKISDEELDKQEARRLKAGAMDPGTNKLSGAASRDPKGRWCVAIFMSASTHPSPDYDTSGRSGQGNVQPQNCMSLPRFCVFCFFTLDSSSKTLFFDWSSAV